MPDPTRRHSRSLIVTLLVIVRNAYFNSSPGPASPFNGDKAILEIEIALQICRRASRRYGIHRSTNNSSSDRKSTRLNSSHTVISYAVFCLKKKKKKAKIQPLNIIHPQLLTDTAR